MQLLESQAQLWQQFQTTQQKERLPQAFLLVAPQHSAPIDFAYQMSAALLCAHEQNKPCGECKSCRLVQVNEHPDHRYLQPEKIGAAIKIDQIRELQGLVFTSPQVGARRVIIINPANKMNESASNALLKLLEEPPASLFFILIAEQLSTIPATILSRCQHWRFTSAEILDGDYLMLGQSYSSESVRGKLFSFLPEIINDLSALVNNKKSLSVIATKWSTYETNDFFWLFYLINSQMLSYQLIGRQTEKDWTEQLFTLAKGFKPVFLFQQLQQVTETLKKLNQNLNMNQALVFEILLADYAKHWNT